MHKKFQNFFEMPPPSSFVQNFLVIIVVFSVWLYDENLCSYRAKRMTYYQKKLHESSLLSTHTHTRAVTVQRESAKTRKRPQKTEQLCERARHLKIVIKFLKNVQS